MNDEDSIRQKRKIEIPENNEIYILNDFYNQMSLQLISVHGCESKG